MQSKTQQLVRWYHYVLCNTAVLYAIPIRNILKWKETYFIQQLPSSIDGRIDTQPTNKEPPTRGNDNSPGVIPGHAKDPRHSTRPSQQERREQ